MMEFPPGCPPNGEWDMRIFGSNFGRALAVALFACFAGRAEAQLEWMDATNPLRNHAPDPRAIGKGYPYIRTDGDEIVRAANFSDGTPQRCTQFARFEVGDGGGPQAIELGIERIRPTADAPATGRFFFRLRYLDGPNGTPVAIERPVLDIRAVGPTTDWQIAAIDRNGWIRASQQISKISGDDYIWFTSEIEGGGNRIVLTLPSGEPRAYSARTSVSAWHYNIFGRCMCRLIADFPASVKKRFPCD